MEGNRELVGGNFRTIDHIHCLGIDRAELGIFPELPGEIHIVSIQRLTIGPDQVGAQAKRPGFEIGAHAAVCKRGDFCCDACVKLALRVAIDERCVQAIHDHSRKRFIRGIRKE